MLREWCRHNPIVDKALTTAEGKAVPDIKGQIEWCHFRGIAVWSEFQR
jgi:hypothetical protein